MAHICDASVTLQRKQPWSTVQQKLSAEIDDPKTEKLFAATQCLGNDNLTFDESKLLRSDAMTVSGFLVPIPIYD